MKVAVFIIGILLVAAGLGMTVYGWYVAHSTARIFDALAYGGPFLAIIGAWRVISAGMVARPSVMFRIIAVGLGFAAGYGNTAAIKAAFPDDQVVTTSNTH